MEVVFTAAIMDVFHNGHKNIIDTMKQHGLTIVVLHDDISCFKIKDKFPINTLEQRIRNVYLAGADIVIPTYNTDPAEEFEKIATWFPSAKFLRGDDNWNPPGKWKLDEMGVIQKYIPYTKSISSTKRREDNVI